MKGEGLHLSRCAFTEETVALGPGRPDQVGQPWSDLVGNGTSDGDHEDHLHAGWRQGL